MASPVIEQEEIDAVNRVLQSGMLAQGPNVAQLEADFAAYCGTKYAVAVNSGTAGLHAALHAAGVGPGDEVITTPFSFIATINCILMAGATPILADIDPITYNLDPQKVASVITAKTKAVIPVHLYGQPADCTELRSLADARKLVIVEDACQAVGAEYKGKKTGSLGELGCFSLYATKNIMSGEGGVITTNSEAYATAMKQFRQHGMSAQYEYTGLGYNYRLSDLHAAIGVEQLKKVERFTASRRANAARLDAGLRDVPGLVLPVVAADRTHVYHQYTIRVTNDFAAPREALIAQLQAAGIGTGIFYPKGLHSFPHIQKFGYKLGDFPEAERAGAEVLSLPVHPRVSAQDIDLIVATIKKAGNGGKKA